MATSYYLEALSAATNVYETLIQKELLFDTDVLKRANTLYDQAVQYQRAEDCQAAVPLLQQARRLYANAGKGSVKSFGSGVVRTLVVEAICQLDAKDYVASLTTLLGSLVIVQTLPLGTPTTERFLEAKHQYEQGNFPEALKIYEEVLKVYRASKNENSTAQTLLDIGTIYGQMNQYLEAEPLIRQALYLFSKPANKNEYTAYNRAAADHNLGNLAIIMARYDEAISEFGQAVQLWQENGNPTQEVVSLSGLGLALRGQGRYAEALQVLQSAHARQQKLSHAPETEGDILNNLGYVAYSLGRYAEADRLFQQALQQYRQLPQPLRTQKETATQGNLGTVKARTGQLVEAQQTYQQVLDYANKNDRPVLAAQTYVNLADLAMQRGDYQTAIATYLKALPVFEKNNMQFGQTAVEQNIGAAYLKLGDLANSEAYMKKALKLFEASGNREGIATLQNNLGLLFAQVGRYDKAKAAFTQAATIWQALGNAVAASRASANLALISVAQNDPSVALTQAEAALQFSEQAGLQADQVHSLLILSVAQLRQGDGTASLASAQRALTLATQMGDPVAEMGSHILLARTYLATKQLTLAGEHVQKAIDQLESLQGVITVPELNGAFLGQLADVYDLAVLIALANQQPNKAFLYTEQTSARAFLDQLGNQRIDFRQRAGADALQQQQTLRQQIIKLQEDLNAERAKELSQQKSVTNLEKELETARTDYGKLMIELKVTEPEYAALDNVNVLTLPQIQQQVVDAQTTLIVYFTLNNAISSKTLAWVIDRQKTQLVGLDITSKELQNQVEFLYKTLPDQQQRLDPNVIAQMSGRLYERLFAPLKPYIQHQNLIIVPHGVLRYLPFAALWDAKSRHYLIEDYAITYAPSASVLKFIQAKRNRNDQRLLVMGDEAEQIAGLYGVKPLTGTAASETQIYVQSSQVDILHLTAPIAQNAFHPLFSYIDLAPDDNNDGRLEIDEIYNRLDLKGVNLVVVAAGDAQSVNTHDETTGFAQAFLYAGAPDVITSQWEVDHRVTAFLMEKFYTYLRSGMDMPEALHRAQIDTMQQPEYAQPYYWAGFILTGDYKNAYTVAPLILWPWIASISTLIALLLLSIGFVYVRVAQPNDIPFPEALQLLRLSFTTKGGYLAYHWNDFHYRIEKALFEQGMVTGKVLQGLPTSLWTDALRRYYLENPPLDLILHEKQQQLEHGKAELIGTFNRTWENVHQAINNRHDGTTEIQALVHCFAQLVDLEITTPAANQIGLLHYFDVDVGPAFPDLPRMKIMPLMVHASLEWRENDLDDIRNVLRHTHSTEHPLSIQSIGILISFIEPIKIQGVRGQLDKKLRQTYACDVNLLSKADILTILFRKDARQAFGNAVLQDVSLEILSPYQTEGPVSPDAFFGRESELRKIMANVHRHSYAIIGGRKIGKSSLWLQLHQRRLPAADFYTLVLDCQKINSYEQFLTASIQEGQAHLPLPLPKTMAEVLMVLPLDKPLIVLLDEADKLIGPDQEAHWPLFNQLRALVNSGRIQIVLFGEYTLHAALQDDNGPLYNLVESMILGVLEHHAVEELVTRPMKQLRVDFVDEAAVVQRIYQFTSGHPAIVQSLCNRLITHLNERKTRTIGVEDVNAIIEKPQFQDEDFLKIYLAQATPLEEIIVLLLAQQPGVHRLTEILKVVEDEAMIYPGLEVTQVALNRLVNLRSILSYSQQGYTFAVEAFPRVLANSVTVADQIAVQIEKYKREETKV